MRAMLGFLLEIYLLHTSLKSQKNNVQQHRLSIQRILPISITMKPLILYCYIIKVLFVSFTSTKRALIHSLSDLCKENSSGTYYSSEDLKWPSQKNSMPGFQLFFPCHSKKNNKLHFQALYQ